MSKEHVTVSGELTESALEYTPVDAVSGIVSTLRESFNSGKLREIDYRKQQLRALLRGIREQRDALLDAMVLDLHKSQNEGDFLELSAVEFEIGRFLDNLSKWAKPDRNPLSRIQPVFLLSSSEIRKEPLGTVVIIGPWNYPLRLLLLPLIGAIAAGNTVVLKPSELAPHTALAIENLLTKYLDPEVVRVVQGGVVETTALLKEKFDHYFYTGGGPVGKIVMRAAAEHLSGVTLELGGKTPAIVHADVADLGPTATRIMWCKLTNAGQTCVAVDYLLVHRSIKDKLIPLLVDAATGMFGKNPQKSADYGRIINGRHWKRLMAVLDATEGALVNVTDDQADENDRFIPPTIVDGVKGDDSLMKDELFGPILPIITYDTLDEAISFVNSRNQPLALYAFSSNATANHIISHTRSGGAVVNDTMLHLASHTHPFGGVGPSGTGRYHGKYSFDTFSHHRTVVRRPLWFPSPAVDTVRVAPLSGKENEWKRSLGFALVYPQTWSLRESFFGKLITLLPFWRVFGIIVPFLRALVVSKPILNKNKRQ
ncbi:Hexadecenal dehydrogenase [Dipsacomyces acuminosporus]|nr:Hexadecenal dehydrogenase [Dipsacomyces acuminosporus]